MNAKSCRLKLHRRQFLSGVASAVMLPSAACAQVRAGSPGASNPWTKRGVVLHHQGEPAGGVIQNFTSAAEPLPGGRWRLWCSVSGNEKVLKNIGFAEGTVGEALQPIYATLSAGEPDASAPLAIGNLPAGWRPVQPVHLRLNDGRHRIYFWAHDKGVVRYLAADSTDGRAYRVVNPLRPCLYHISDRAVDGAELAKAGLTRRSKRQAKPVKGEPLAPAALISNDATNVYQLPDGSFEMYSVALMQVGKDDRRYMPMDNIPGLIRVIDRYTSSDGLHWQDRQRVLAPDADDPHDLQFYYLSVTHTSRGRVGILGHYRLETQTIDMEWCCSADGIHWQRSARRPWLPRGDASQVDSYMVFAPHAMVERDGQWWLFYTGDNSAHNHRASNGPHDRAVLLATARGIWG